MLSFVCERERVKLLGLSAHRPEEFLGFPFLLRLGLKPVCECVCALFITTGCASETKMFCCF